MQFTLTLALLVPLIFILVFSFLAEAYLYIKVSQIIPDHIKGLVDATPAEPPGNAQPKGNLN
jgi:hypothetical protein